jgi:acyl-CoA thioesterase I
MIITRRCVAIFLIPLLVWGCQRPESEEVVRSAPPEVSPPPVAELQGGRSSADAPGEPAPSGSDPRPVVLFLGTSLTEGLGLPADALPYPGVVQRWVDEAGLPFRVVNAGVSGDTSAGGLARLGWVLRGPVEVLVVELGANDGLRGLPVRVMGDNLRTIIRRARAHHPGMEVVLLAMEAPPNLGGEYITAFRNTFAEVAREEEAALVPFFLDGIAGVPTMNLEDGIHPTAEGHLQMAERVWTVLEPILRHTAAQAGVEEAA